MGKSINLAFSRFLAKVRIFMKKAFLFQTHFAGTDAVISTPALKKIQMANQLMY
jgi:hypothetical protein